MLPLIVLPLKTPANKGIPRKTPASPKTFVILVDILDIFYFFCSGEGEREVRGARKKGVFLMKSPGGGSPRRGAGGAGAGPGGCPQRILGGGWGGA